MSVELSAGITFPEEKEIPQQFKMEVPVEHTKYLIDGQLRDWDGPRMDVWSAVCIRDGLKVTQKRLGSYPLLTENEALEALHSAVHAYDRGLGLWPTMSVSGRIKHVEEFARCMEQKKEAIVNLLMWEIGKSYEDSVKEFDRTIKYIDDTIEALKDLDRNSSRFTIEEEIIAHIKRSPLGVVLCMGPYNYPLNETFTLLIPALIMGNTVIVKPPRLGVLVYSPLLEAFRDCFPNGVVNMVYGDGEEVVKPIMTSGDINVLAFIGSAKVATLLKKHHPRPHRLRCCLGLEAKNPAIILPNADLDLTIKECITGALSYNGQRCTALKMIFVHSSIASEFIERFQQAVAGLKRGMPWETGVKLTPLPELGKIEYLTELVEDARQQGAEVINEGGGHAVGTFLNPAILYPVNENMRVYHEEQFGPVIPILAFDDLETPIEYIINSNYGQQVSIFGSDPDEIAHLIDPLVNQVSRVNINSQCQRGPDVFPFTGRKDSAEATLSVSDALRVFSIRTLVATKSNDSNQRIITDIVRDHKSNFLSTDYIF